MKGHMTEKGNSPGDALSSLVVIREVKPASYR